MTQQDPNSLYRRTRPRNTRRRSGIVESQPTPRPMEQGQAFRLHVPRPEQAISQIVPDILVAITGLVIMVIGPLAPLGVPIWTLAFLVPSVVTYLLANTSSRPLWRRTAVVNALILGVVFPVLVVRQSVVQIPYLDRSTGTLWPPLIATVGACLALMVVAIVSAVLSNEDPEYSGVLYLPAAMLVPLLAGPTDISGFRSAVGWIVVIYIVVAVLTIVASMLPGAYPTLVAPLAIAIEFLALPANRSGSIFPIGSGAASKILFFGIVLVAVALAIAVPTVSLWVRETRRIVSQQSRLGQF